MPNNNAKAILQAIYDTLTAAPSLVPATLRQVKIGADADHSAGFPFCRIFLTDFSSAVADTASYERKYSFAVDILQEFSNKSRQNAELDFCNALDAVLDRLNGSWQLGTTVENTEVETSTARTVDIAGTPMRMASIRVTVTTLVQNPA